MASSYTTNLNLEKPGIGEQDGDWGATLNSNFDTIDTKLAIKDEDNMASDSASHLATQQSIKAYVDSQVATEDTLTELNDTSISSPAAGHLIIYDNTASHWENATLTAGSNVSITNGDGAITIASTDTNTQLSQEQVEDYVGGMLDGTETFIDVSYDDTDGNIDFVVPVKDEDAMGSDSATHLATQQSIKAYVDGKVGTIPADDISTGDAAVSLATSAGNITIDAQGNDTDIILKGTDGSADTTFLTIDGSDAGTASFNHDVKLANDAAVLGFGADNDVTLTHVADTGVTLSAGDNATVLQLDSNDSGGSSGPKILLNRTSDSPADDDYSGTIIWNTENDNNQQFKAAQISVQATDVSDGTEDSNFQIATIVNGSATTGVTVSGSGIQVPDSGKIGSVSAPSAIDINSAGEIGVGTTANASITLLAYNNETGHNALRASQDNASSTTAVFETTNDGQGYGIYSVNGNGSGIYGSASRATAGYFVQDGAVASNYGVYGQSASNYGLFGRTLGTSSGGIIGYDDAAACYGIIGYSPSTTLFSLYGNGSAYVAGSYTGSDSRLKDIQSRITTSDGMLAKVNQLKPTYYKWKSNSDQGLKDTEEQIGFIAQEVESIFSHVVKEAPVPDLSESLADADGKVEKRDKTLNEELGDTKFITYEKLTVYLTAALQEASAKIDTLEARIKTLEDA